MPLKYKTDANTNLLFFFLLSLQVQAFLLFLVLWPFAVYYPLAHWIWNSQGWLKDMGVLDFAGGMVIHTSSGVAGKNQFKCMDGWI